MKVSDLLESRRENWQKLERLCGSMRYRGKKAVGAEKVSEFGRLYRAACADLALADAYGLPPNTVQYLHRLVAKAHTELHRSTWFSVREWFEIAFVETPQKIFSDRWVHASFLLFWGLFLCSFYLAKNEETWPGFAETVVGEQQLEGAVLSFEEFDDRPFAVNFQMAGFYISHNTGIGFRCFATSLLLIPGLITMTFNAVSLGATFGYMFRPDIGEASANFQNFVTAHGPFELTAIVLSCGAGLRIGASWLITDGLTRMASVLKTARETLPMIVLIIVLFGLAALIEGFVSPTTIPWVLKGCVAIISSGMLMFYFVVLGFPRGAQRAAR